MKTKKLLPVKADFGYIPTRSFANGNPYVIAFVYPRKGEAFVVKGGLRHVEPYLSGFGPAIVHYDYYRHGKIRCRHVHVINIPKELDIYIGEARYPTENSVIYDESFLEYGGKPKRRNNVRNVKRRELSVSRRKGLYGIARTLLYKKTLRHAPRCWMKELDQFLS